MMAWIKSGSGQRESTKGSTLAHKANLYETPAKEALPALMAAEKLPWCLWEPAAGRGALVRLLRAAGHIVVATDLNAWPRADEGITTGVDFLMEHRAPDGTQAIITNPPFNIAAQFIEKALTLCPRVYMLLRLSFMEGGTGRSAEALARKRILDGPWRPARLYVFRRRLPMMHRDGYEGRAANSGMAFAWFVWDAAATGPTTIERISWHERSADRSDQGALHL